GPGRRRSSSACAARAGPPRRPRAARRAGSAATRARSGSPSGRPRRGARAPRPAAGPRRRPGHRTSRPSTRPSTAGTPGRAAAAGSWHRPPGPVVVRERDAQPADLARARRPQLGPDQALEVLPEQPADPVAKLLELGGGDVQDPVAEHGRLAPFLRLVRAGL